MRIRLAVLGCLLGVFALGVSACGSDDEGGGGGGGGGGATVQGNSLTIYSSLPLQGTSKEQSEAVINGEKLALKQAGSKVGNFTLKYVSLDDSTAQNARQAVQDKTTIFYLGEFNSGGTKVSLPILNKGGIPQISPSNTYVGLTTDKPGSEPGEPDKYYPTGERTYARVVPADDIQAAALVTTMKEDGCKSVHIWNDKQTYGAGLARNIEQAAEANQVSVEGNDGIDEKAANYRSLAAKVEADCWVFSGITGSGAVQAFKDVSAANPQAKLYGPDGVAEAAFTDPKEGGIPTDVAKKTKVTVATLAPEEFPPEGQKFFEEFKAKYGVKDPDPYSIYGYESMALALDVLKRAGADANDRKKVAEELLNTKDRKSVLGTYSIDENGDTTLTDYGLYKVEKGKLVFDKTIKAEGT